MASALPETLKSVTATKIVELKKQRQVYEDSRAQIITSLKDSNDSISKARALLKGVCKLEGIHIPDETSSDDEQISRTSGSKANQLRNQHIFVRHSHIHAAFPKNLLNNVQKDLNRDLELKRIRHQQAQFFSELVTEWISNPDAEHEQTPDSEATEASSFENVGRKEMHEQRIEWEDLVFTRSKVDVVRMKMYLERLFTSSKSVTNAFETLKKATNSKCSDLRFHSVQFFNPEMLQFTIKGLLKTDLLGDEKRSILKTFSTNKEVLEEVSDVLNMRFASLDTWEWSTVNSAINLEQRRQLNGKYRVYMDEDVLDALLIHAIGMKWAIFFKQKFTNFYNSFAWHKGGKLIPVVDRERREWFLGDEAGTRKSRFTPENVHARRSNDFAKDYFMTQLPVEETEGARGYGDSDDGKDEDSTRKSPIEIKHSLLHLVIAEAQLARHLRPDDHHAVLRSDFKWFGPSLPHETIFTVLRFFGMDEFWLKFIRKFLEAPMRFIQDGTQGQIQTRQRGVPISHALSDVLSEVILFVMDFAVNHSTKNNLYRLHDDFWFWGSLSTVHKGWDEMKVFASTMGIEFNMEKTGSVVFAPKSATDNDSDSDDSSLIEHNDLPTGEIRWGFLQLDADNVRFEIDLSMVDEHIRELQLQLSYCRSIFSYIQAYNAYLAKFFSNNFGKPSYGFGRPHVDMMIKTFAHIQKELFPQGSVTDHLQGLAEDRFGIKNLPDGFWYWPVQFGGLELRNPFVPLFGMWESLFKSPAKLLDEAFEQDEILYFVSKDRFEKENTGSGLGSSSWKQIRSTDLSHEEFMFKDEFMRYREETSRVLATHYAKLLDVPPEKPVESTPEIQAWLKSYTPSGNSKTFMLDFGSMRPYWAWILAVYGAEILDRYGSIQMVDAGQVPLGVVSVLKAGKIRWKG